MADARHPAVYSIPPTRPFSDALVDGLLAMHGDDPLALARGMILVPNSRAGLAIRDAFVRRARTGLLLPRLIAIGDIDLNENAGAGLDPITDDPIPPAVDPLVRQLILARLIQQQDASDAAEAMRLAAELGRTLDQLIVEEKSGADLRAIDAGDLQQHWSKSLNALHAILKAWPRALKDMGRIDRAERRNRQLDRLTERWRTNPPPGFVIVAGISTAAPAIARLLRAIAFMPRGQVILSGLDLHLSDADWAALAGDDRAPPVETHPQFHLRQLLDRMGVARAEVRAWEWGKAGHGAGRERTINHAFALPATTRGWVHLEAADVRLRGVHALTAPTPSDEALAIALAIREALERPERTVALVTPDRELARRVCAMLLRWGLQADDSAGQPLGSTPGGSLILALATASAERFAPAALMTLLKHPLVRAGEHRLDWLDGARALDLALRGPRPAPGLAGIDRFLAGSDDYQRAARENVREWWAAAHDLLLPIETAGGDLGARLATLRGVATSLGGDGVWSGPAGRALGDLLSVLEAEAANGPELRNPEALPALLRPLLDAIAIRPAYGGHPRVFIWGLLEARLQSADLMILSGLNEGVWPQIPAPDPWLAPQIRRQLGLPGLERRIGLSGHDLASALGAPSVLLTRSMRDARSPTIASRFWLRIEAMTGGLKPPELAFDRLARSIDAPLGKPARAGRPAPCPPRDERPKSIAVTDADRLAADPFAYYAKAILGLRVLDPLDADPGGAWRGTLIHAVLDRWAKDDGYAAGSLGPRMISALDDARVHPLVRALWLPRLTEAAHWIEARVTTGRAEGRVPMESEIRGSAEHAGVTITSTADRIDRLPDGGLAIIDYKTGEAPRPKQVAAGYAMQLGLVGLLAEKGGFKNVAGTAEAFEYWSLSRDPKTRAYGKVTSPVSGKATSIAAADFVDRIAAQFADTAGRWLTGNEPFEAKRRPEYARDDYDHLMRLEEWEGRDV
jgi:ATP-dependent helicase/nuclease subunit B